MASGTAMVDAECSQIQRTVKEVSVAVDAGVQTLKVTSSTLGFDAKDIFPMAYHGRRVVLEVLGLAGEMSTRTLGCSRVKVEHCGVDAIVEDLSEFLFCFLRKRGW